MMALVNYIIVGWSIRGVAKIKLMGTSIYEFTKGNIMKFDMGRRLMGFFVLPKMVALGASDSLSQINFSS